MRCQHLALISHRHTTYVASNVMLPVEKCRQGDDSYDSPCERTTAEEVNASVVVFAERSSPERPFVRPPNATAKQLIEIHRNYRRGVSQEWPVFLPPNMDEDLQNLEHPDPAKRPRYLPLAPPYHLLPNTSFFRKTSIKPPPSYITDGLPPLKRIINRYLASILVDHVKLEEQLRLFIEERKKHEEIEQRKLREEMEENEDVENKFEKPKYDDFSTDNGWKIRRKPRIVVQHLHYGGQLIHYIQNACDSPPAVPGYFTTVPLIPGNVRITREFSGTALAEYHQQRTAHGFIYIPVTTTIAESYTEQGPSQSNLSPLSPKTAVQTDQNEQIGRRSDSEDEIVNCEGTAPPGFSVITTERYTSISFTANTMSMQFAERCVSLSRSPQSG
ncbi:hypothetical protein Y032_0865g2757 [Ancylostoma ceylanicum]|uniref:Uncharacterized protein n=1 Tax=Ancylostoma ceylanicum TaxID=53326 RepID=A0A016WA39_9BILA|nr:hypothetical protein Y032_0865g2757 [Ancylostoma ceylanicum]